MYRSKSVLIMSDFKFNQYKDQWELSLKKPHYGQKSAYEHKTESPSAELLFCSYRYL